MRAENQSTKSKEVYLVREKFNNAGANSMKPKKLKVAFSSKSFLCNAMSVMSTNQ